MTTIYTIIISAVKRLLDQRKPSTFAEYISQATSCVETVQRGYEWKQLPERLRIQDQTLDNCQLNSDIIQ